MTKQNNNLLKEQILNLIDSTIYDLILKPYVYNTISIDSTLFIYNEIISNEEFDLLDEDSKQLIFRIKNIIDVLTNQNIELKPYETSISEELLNKFKINLKLNLLNEEEKNYQEIKKLEEMGII